MTLQQPPRSMMSLPMSRLVVVIVLQEEVLVRAVSRECHSRDAQAGEAASESLKPRERAVVSPCLSESQSVIGSQPIDR